MALSALVFDWRSWREIRRYQPVLARFVAATCSMDWPCSGTRQFRLILDVRQLVGPSYSPTGACSARRAIAFGMPAKISRWTGNSAYQYSNPGRPAGWNRAELTRVQV